MSQKDIMKIAFVGLGKLGFPCALAAATKHDVVGCDVSPLPAQYLAKRSYPHREEGVAEMLQNTTLRVVDTTEEAVAHAEIVFVAVQTPHRPELEGSTRMPDERAVVLIDTTISYTRMAPSGRTCASGKRAILVAISSPFATVNIRWTGLQRTVRACREAATALEVMAS